MIQKKNVGVEKIGNRSEANEVRQVPVAIFEKYDRRKYYFAIRGTEKRDIIRQDCYKTLIENSIFKV